MNLRDAFLMVVRSYIGTPYVHRGRLPGVALDCAGLVVCALRECGVGVEDPQYGMLPTIDGLEAGLERIAVRRPLVDARPGDLIANVYHRNLGHLAVCSGDGLCIQALAKRGSGTVRETLMVNARSAWAVRGM